MKFVNKNDFDANQFSLESADFLKQRKVTPPPIILDIRTQEEFTADHLVGAHSLPADSLEDNLMQLPPFGQVLLYGGSDLEKTEAGVKLLNENNFTDIGFAKNGFDGLIETLKSSDEEIFLTDLPVEERRGKIEEVLNEKVRPALASDGGGLTLMNIEEDRVFIHYEGACGSCPSSTAGTLRFIQTTLSVHLNKEIEVISS